MVKFPPPPADQHLWDELRKSVRPLRDHSATGFGAILTGAARPRQEPPQTLPYRKHGPAAPPPLGGLERRTAQKLSRGQIEPDSRIDLHGETVVAARVKLQRFLEQRQTAGDRLVLVITGKGASPFSGHMLHGHRITDSPERQGRLRREVPLWLHEDVFRHVVTGFQPAHPRHGGGGALYLRLRRLQQVNHDTFR